MNKLKEKIYENIKFTYGVEHNGKISFLQVLLMKSNEKIETMVFRRESNSDINLQWRFFVPITWKKSTSRTLTRRAYTVHLTYNLLQE